MTEPATAPLSSYPLARAVGLYGRPLKSVAEAQLRETEVLALAFAQLPRAIEQAALHQTFAITDALGNVSRDVRALESRLDSLIEVVAEGFYQLASLSEAQLQTLDHIRDVLETPLGTQGRECRRRGIRAYDYGLLQEASADLLEAIKADPYDYVSHLHLGHVHLRVSDWQAAVASYLAASRYALAPPSGDPSRNEVFAALAHLGAARAFGHLGDGTAAVEHATLAEGLRPQRPDVQFELARSLVVAGRAGDDKRFMALCSCLWHAPLTYLPVVLADPALGDPSDAVSASLEAATSIRGQLTQKADDVQRLNRAYADAGLEVAGSQGTTGEEPGRLAEVVRSNAIVLTSLATDLQALRAASQRWVEDARTEVTALEAKGNAGLMAVQTTSHRLFFWLIVVAAMFTVFVVGYTLQAPDSSQLAQAISSALIGGGILGLVLAAVASGVRKAATSRIVRARARSRVARANRVLYHRYRTTTDLTCQVDQIESELTEYRSIPLATGRASD